ncbi:glycosyltransferase family 2 protein [Leifsonia aquatica]|uniref:glycosyltransferase family 2 protein n=1 Tax=Leifsonia aquatica TaxID=144185 RepID=UPI0004682AD4|nr:glycosyltransferase [Leifsonia aquatica]
MLQWIGVVVCLILALTGFIPVVAAAVTFLVIPFHAWINHYKKAAPYLPRVAIVVPAWNEGAVIGASIDRLMKLDYPKEALRIYVVDDASTDDTPEVVRSREAQYPGNVFLFRREQGGQGKAHTLNHGISRILEEDWMEALLVMDADVIYLPDSLRRMTRHLADPAVGAVSAYIREGSSVGRNYLTKFIGVEYVLSQPASRRAQNVMGAQACLAGGAQLHTRENIVAIGGRIDTSSLAEDTITTFETQIQGRTVVFEPHAHVLAEEPSRVDALWKQRLRWARGNVTVTARYAKVWFRPSKVHHLGGFMFGLMWFSLLLLPLIMVVSAVGLTGLLFLQSPFATGVFRALWISASLAYLFVLLLGSLTDTRTSRHALGHVLLFPGIINMLVMVTALFPTLMLVRLPAVFGVTLSDAGLLVLTLLIYIWMPVSMLVAWLARVVEKRRALRWLAPILVYLAGYGSLLCAITLDSYFKELAGAEARWDKTEKVGRVAV